MIRGKKDETEQSHPFVDDLLVSRLLSSLKQL